MSAVDDLHRHPQPHGYDRTLTVPSLRLGELNRARAIRLDLSGKGINVSRALRLLDVPSRIIAFVGGGTGRAIRDGLAAKGFETPLCRGRRRNRDRTSPWRMRLGVLTKINEPGAPVSPADLAAMAALIERSAAAGDLWAFSGSLPPRRAARSLHPADHAGAGARRSRVSGWPR